VGEWVDAVYLSTDTVWDIKDTRLALITHTAGLSAGQTYTGSANVIIPGIPAGNYYVIVRADIANAERETDEANNLAAGPARSLVYTTLPIDGTARTGSVSPLDPSDFYVFHVDGGEGLKLRLESESALPLELYVRYAATPTILSFDQRATAPTAAQEIAFTSIATGGTYYVQVYGDRAATDYTLVAEQAPFFITSIGPQRHGLAAPAAITITGAGFDETTRVAFVDAGGVERPSVTQFVSPTTLIAHIDFNTPSLAWVPGVYSVRALKGSREVNLSNALEIVAAGGAKLETSLVVPGAMNPGFPVGQTLWVEYANTGTVAMPAPLLQVVADGNAILAATEAELNSARSTGSLPSGLSNSIQLLGVGSSASPGLLQPGERGRLPVYYLGLSTDNGAQQVK
jgi:hypothetical protein